MMPKHDDNARHYHDTDSAETGWCSGCGRTDLRELTFDEATDAGFDGTGRDGDPRFPYHEFDIADDGTYDVDGNR